LASLAFIPDSPSSPFDSVIALMMLNAPHFGRRRNSLREAFPKENAELRARIAKESAVISQFWANQDRDDGLFLNATLSCLDLREPL
jgi:cytochrome P450